MGKRRAESIPEFNTILTDDCEVRRVSHREYLDHSFNGNEPRIREFTPDGLRKLAGLQRMVTHTGDDSPPVNGKPTFLTAEGRPAPQDLANLREDVRHDVLVTRMLAIGSKEIRTVLEVLVDADAEMAYADIVKLSDLTQKKVTILLKELGQLGLIYNNIDKRTAFAISEGVAVLQKTKEVLRTQMKGLLQQETDIRMEKLRKACTIPTLLREAISRAGIPPYPAQFRRSANALMREKIDAHLSTVDPSITKKKSSPEMKALRQDLACKLDTVCTQVFASYQEWEVAESENATISDDMLDTLTEE